VHRPGQPYRDRVRESSAARVAGSGGPGRAKGRIRVNVSKGIRVIVVNTDEDVAADLRTVLLSLEGVRIVAEVDEPALLAQALDQLPAEVLLVHLDPNPAGMMDVVAPLIEAHKGQIAAIAMTENRDAELVMRAMRVGMKEFLWKPFPPEQLGETLQRIGCEATTSGRRLGRLLSVVGTSGGVGATQLAINLAVELAQLEGWKGAATPGDKPKVAIVDMDFRFGQVAMQLDAQPPYTLGELCESLEQIDPQLVDRTMFKHETGVHVLARPNDLGQAERIHANQAASVLSALHEHYDFVVVDMPARFDPSARVVFDMSDTYLLVLQLLVPSVRNADRILHELRGIGYAAERIRLVCNRYGRESGYLDKPDVEATLKRPVEFLIPDDWKSSAGAVNMGAPLLTIGPRSKLRQAYRAIALALAGHEDAPASGSGEPGEPNKKGLFSLFGGAK
jgi:pilus assembly protein CpaE